MRIILLVFFVCMTVVSLPGQSKFTIDEESKKVQYKQVFLINRKIEVDSVYKMAQRWMNDSTKFFQKNAEPPIDTTNVRKMQLKREIDQLFENSRPLQFTDPERRGIVGMAILKYYGNAMSTIKLMYFRYDIYITVRVDTVLLSMSNVHYYHYNPKNYNQTWLYGFNGGKPCEEKGLLEELINCEDFHGEFKRLSSFFNREVYALFIDFKNLLRQKEILYETPVRDATIEPNEHAKKKDMGSKN